jgi:hypothetical protein
MQMYMYMTPWWPTVIVVMVLVGDGLLFMVGSDSFRIVDIVSYQFAIIKKHVQKSLYNQPKPYVIFFYCEVISG